ncbi:MAG: hypothetical protein H6936_08445 [Burkholderiales bacterium]|nr:hypothetical protein [Nitrosomonas sp.]MCP5274860.1 hypothetical protein [Burkholderiales bacterium]
MTCVKQDGLKFILDNIDTLRYELIGYVLLKADLSKREFKQLKQAMVGKKQREVNEMDKADNVMGLVNQLVHYV